MRQWAIKQVNPLFPDDEPLFRVLADEESVDHVLKHNAKLFPKLRARQSKVYREVSEWKEG
jgi:hypothetical protein